MELRCLPSETPASTGSGSPDPLYYCLPHGQRARERDDVAVTGPPLPGLAPAVPEVPTLGGGRGPGSWPAHGYCSWGGGGGGGGGLGRQGCMGVGPGINRAGGGERGGGRERVRDAEEEEERGHRNQSPHPAQSEEHESALSVYDNLRDSAVTPDDDDDQEAEDLLEVAMETGLLDNPLQRQLCRRAEEGGGGGSGDSSSWSSCEILLAGGSSASNGPDQDQDQDQDADQETDPDQQDPEPHVFVHVRVPTPHHRQPLLLRVGLPQPGLPPALRAQGPATMAAAPHHPPGGNPPPQPRVPPPLPRADPSASALRSLLTGLQGQIVRQRDEYETRIHSLQQHNEELQGEVVGLRANLAGQRRWYQAVQAKILESERARDAADLRNAALQAEMEQFFDTFGELNNEAKKAECIVRSF